MKLFLYYEAITIYTKYAYHKDPSSNDFFKSSVQSIIVNDVHKLGIHLMLSIELISHSCEVENLPQAEKYHSFIHFIHLIRVHSSSRILFFCLCIIRLRYYRDFKICTKKNFAIKNLLLTGHLRKYINSFFKCNLY